jgi:transcriptional regulator with GAF, ATPase, and Fis domain
MRNNKGEERGGHEPLAPNSLLAKKKEHIQRVLAMVDGDHEKAAQLLKIPLAELHRLMHKLEIHET